MVNDGQIFAPDQPSNNISKETPLAGDFSIEDPSVPKLDYSKVI